MKLIITALLLAAYYIFIFALISASEAADDKPREKQNEDRDTRCGNDSF